MLVVLKCCDRVRNFAILYNMRLVVEVGIPLLSRTFRVAETLQAKVILCD